MIIPSIAWIVLVAVAAVGGLAIGFLIRFKISSGKVRDAQADAQRQIDAAGSEAKEILLRAQQEAIRARDEAEAEARERRAEIQRQERRVSRKEEQIDARLEGFEKRDQALTDKESGLDRLRGEIEETKAEQVRELERVAQMTAEEAKTWLLSEVDGEIRVEASRRVRASDEAVEAESTERAFKIMAQAMQRYANDVVSELSTTVVSLPSDEMKGRLIGREGRNIRALENATGVNLIVDDTPEIVTISGHDPIRREVAKIAISRLVKDGRIQPARIEELVAKAQEELDEIIQKAGEEACYEVRVTGLAPELVKTMGRLKFRHSYGQNVLRHSIEVGHIAGVIANELRLNQDLCRRAGFLHDIGKALTHEVDGPHAKIGGELLERFNVNQRVVRAVADHHGEEGWRSIEAFVVAAADAISGARPGARRENAEAYVKRLEALEQIAMSFTGVEKAYAIQAGREMRVMVRPEEIDDLAAMRIARDITRKIQESLEYPGQIKVMVIRETRAVEYAR
ncbi:MAG: ribonuclease Y [Chloroflexi bacterium]|nr:ribonuclease Y [Chloroflexota bacterium]